MTNSISKINKIIIMTATHIKPEIATEMKKDRKKKS